LACLCDPKVIRAVEDRLATLAWPANVFTAEPRSRGAKTRRNTEFPLWIFSALISAPSRLRGKSSWRALCDPKVIRAVEASRDPRLAGERLHREDAEPRS